MADTPKSSNQSTSTPALAAQRYTLEEAISLIAQSMAKQSEFQEALVKNSPKRKKTMQEYLKEKPRKRLLRETYQNGRLVNPAGLSRETIEKLDTLAPGIYSDGLVQILRISDGVSGTNSRIHIMYSNKSLEQRMILYMRFPTFTKLVNAVAAEMAARGIDPVKDPVAAPVEDDDNE